MTTLEDIRAKLQAQDNRPARKKFGGSFPFWNTPTGKSTRIRFLPDADQDNVFFWVEKQTIILPFVGILRNDETRSVDVRVPCMEMWGETCPIISEIRPWWNDPNLEDTARKYWKKREYLFQGFVRDCPFAEENVPENPIRQFAIRPQIFKNIKASLLDPDFESLPTDYANGSDFMINKTVSGDYASYVTSAWARKESPLTEEEEKAIKDYGLLDLSEGLPQRPSSDHIVIIKEMFEASMNGELYDPARWGQYYRPFGLQSNADDTEVPGSTDLVGHPKVVLANSPDDSGHETAVETPVDDIPFDVNDSDTVVVEEKSSSAPSDVNAILDMIKKRQTG